MKKLLYSLCTLALLFLGANIANAQDDMGMSRGEASETIKLVELANDLVTYGQKNEDAYSLVAAARIIMQFNAEAAGSDKVTAEKGTSEAPADAVKGDGMERVKMEASAILDLAESIAKKNRNSELQQVIASLKKQAASGARGYAYGKGYIQAYYNIPAYGYRDFNWTFLGRELAEIAFLGDGDTDIDVYVYDKTGRLLGSSTTNWGQARFAWVPDYTYQYTFRVRNRGPYTNTVYVISN